MKKQIPLSVVLGIGLAIVVAVGWFGLVGPKRGASAKLDEEIAAYETRVQVASRPKDEAAPPVVEIEVADLFRLTKAMPDRDDMPGMLLELNSVAVSAGVRFVSIQPVAAVEHDGYYTIPVTVTFLGNYYDLTDFLFRLRNLVSVRDGELDASGRLYTLDSMQFDEGEEGFPQIQAVLTLSAYSFGVPLTAAGAAAAAGAPPPTTTGETTTTSATTTTTTTTEAPPADPSGDGNPQAAGGTG